MANQQFCLLLNPSLLTQSDFAAKTTTIWLSLYRVEKILTKSNYLIRKIGTPYTQCVHRIRLRQITPNYEVEDFSVTLDDFRPDPGLGKYRSEHEMFDLALEKSMEVTSLYQNLPLHSRNEPDEVQHTIQGVIAGPAVAARAVSAPAGGTPVAQAQADATQVGFRADRTPPFPAPPAPEPEPPDEPEILFLPEPNLDMAPTQVRNNSSQPDVPAHETENAADEDEAPTTPEDSSGRTDNRSQVRILRQAADPSVCQSFHRLKFDSCDHYRNIPTRNHLIDGGYYPYLDKQAAQHTTHTRRKTRNFEKYCSNNKRATYAIKNSNSEYSQNTRKIYSETTIS